MTLYKPRTNYLGFDISWMEDARCRKEGVSPDRVFTDTSRDAGGRMVMREMQEFCAGCEVRSECLAYAIEADETGIWAGTTHSQRAFLRKNACVPPADRW